MLLEGIKPRIYNDLNKFGKRWMKELPSVVWSLRMTPSRATGFSPFFLVYGAEAILPTDLEYGVPEDKGVRRSKKPDQPRRLTGPSRRGSGRGLTTLGTVSAVCATLPRPRGSAPRLPGGRLGTSAAARRLKAPLTPPWEGPFIIAKILKPGTYKLANDQGEVYSNAWNIQQLRLFYP
jgi:hypothetical protein